MEASKDIGSETLGSKYTSRIDRTHVAVVVVVEMLQSFVRKSL